MERELNKRSFKIIIFVPGIIIMDISLCRNMISTFNPQQPLKNIHSGCIDLQKPSWNHPYIQNHILSEQSFFGIETHRKHSMIYPIPQHYMAKHYGNA